MATRGKQLPQPPVETRWQFTWDGELYREDDVTFGEAERIEKLTGQSWLVMNPLRSAVQAVAIITVMVATRKGRDEDEVAAEIRAAKPDEFLQSFERVPPDRPTVMENGHPPVAAAHSTGSSRSSGTRRTAGRRP